MILPVTQHGTEEIGATEEKAIFRPGGAQGHVITATGAGVPAINHEFFGGEPGLMGGLIQKSGLFDQIFPAGDWLHIHLDHPGVGARRGTEKGAETMGRLTTHVLDTTTGLPAADLAIALWRIAPDGARTLLVETRTNADGRVDRPLLEGTALEAGKYEIVFAAGDYFRALGLDLPEPLFVDEVALRFGIANVDEHYHVPLLVSPWSYSTYRGS